jgi:hypothetical protein
MASLDLELVIYQIGKLGSLVCLSCQSTGTCNHVVPVWFDFDGENLYAGGINLLKSTNLEMF